MKFRSMRPL